MNVSCCKTFLLHKSINCALGVTNQFDISRDANRMICLNKYNNIHALYCYWFQRLSKKSISFQGDYIWIEPISGNEFDVAIGARVISAEGRRIAVRDDDSEEHWLQPDRRIKAMHTTSIHGVEDMIGLGDLHEAGILRNLLIRYNENLIYVRSGDDLFLF